MPSFDEMFMAGLKRHCALPDLAPEELEAWLEDFERILGVYPQDVLERARDRLIGEAGRGYILLSLPRCKAVCEQIHHELHRPPVSRRSDRFTGPEPEQIETARRLIRGELGRRAVSEGWIVALYDFCLAHSRLPTPDEAARLQASAAAVNATLTRERLAGAFAAARRAIQAKAARLSLLVAQEAA